MDFANIPEEIKKKVLECKSAEEMADLAKDAGVNLSDEELESIAGGFSWCARDGSGCPCLCDVHSR